MKTSGSNFDLIMQELLNQKQILEDLEAENQELRKQLSDLRSGQGIIVDILGERFSLNRAITAPIGKITAELPQAIQPLEDAPTSAIAAIASTTPIPEVQQSPLAETEEAEASTFAPTMLEDMLYEEFTKASTNPMAIWTNSEPKTSPIEEDEKASLRRELMGSFLLE